MPRATRIMATLKTLKKSLAGHKGQLKIALMSFNSILAVKPHPTSEAVEQAYKKVRDRLTATFTACDLIANELGSLDDSTVDTNVDCDKENESVVAYVGELINEEAKVESLYVEFKSKHKPNTTPALAP